MIGALGPEHESTTLVFSYRWKVLRGRMDQVASEQDREGEMESNEIRDKWLRTIVIANILRNPAVVETCGVFSGNRKTIAMVAWCSALRPTLGRCQG